MTDELVVRLRAIRAALRREGLASVDAYLVAAPEQVSRLDPADRAFVEWAIRDGQAEVLAVLFSPARRRVAWHVTRGYVIGLVLIALLLVAATLPPLATMVAVAEWLRWAQ